MTEAWGSVGVLRLALATAVAVAAAGVVRADQDCNFPHFRFTDDGVTSASIWVRSGAGCKFHFEIPNSVFGLSGILSSSVTLRPRNGLLGRNTSRIYVYKPNDGFVGADQFEIKVHYNRDNNTGDHVSLLRIDATVSK